MISAFLLKIITDDKILQSNQVKHTPGDYINELII